MRVDAGAQIRSHGTRLDGENHLGDQVAGTHADDASPQNALALGIEALVDVLTGKEEPAWWLIGVVAAVGVAAWLLRRRKRGTASATLLGGDELAAGDER